MQLKLVPYPVTTILINDLSDGTMLCIYKGYADDDDDDDGEMLILL